MKTIPVEQLSERLSHAIEQQDDHLKDFVEYME